MLDVANPNVIAICFNDKPRLDLALSVCLKDRRPLRSIHPRSFTDVVGRKRYHCLPTVRFHFAHCNKTIRMMNHPVRFLVSHQSLHRLLERSRQGFGGHGFMRVWYDRYLPSAACMAMDGMSMPWHRTDLCNRLAICGLEFT